MTKIPSSESRMLTTIDQPSIPPKKRRKVRSPIQIRKWYGGAMFYVVIRCSVKGCVSRWKSSFYQNEAAAEAYKLALPKRPVCLHHERKS